MVLVKTLEENNDPVNNAGTFTSPSVYHPISLGAREVGEKELSDISN